MDRPVENTWSFNACVSRWCDYICRRKSNNADRLILNLPGGDPTRPINLVKTARYTLLNFFFKCGAEQFRNLSNVYFLIIVILALLGTHTALFESPYSAAGTLLGLVLVLAFTMAFEGYYDIKRHREDREVNNRVAQRLRVGDGFIEEIPWSQVRPGDLLKVKDRAQFPADLLFATSCAVGNKCYVETANIDGETNLKIKNVPKALVDFTILPDLAATLNARIEYDLPSAFLTFSGTMKVEDRQQSIDIPLDSSNVLLRGSVLRNTPWVLGYVLYAGKETKVVQSSSNPPTKMSRIQKLVNKIIVIILVVDLIMCTISSLAEIYGFQSNSELYYLKQPDDNTFLLPRYIANVCTFLVLYSSLLPISLLFCMTFSNFWQAMFVHWDLDMYHEETDTPAKCNTMELVQELGQVSYVFSDKTGTLTRNEMKLVGMSIGGRAYGIGNDVEGTASSSGSPLSEIFADVIKVLRSDDPGDVEEREALVEFLLVLAVCHTVLVDTTTGSIQYNAEGPDEEALVTAAAEVGLRLTSTDSGSYTVRFDHEIDLELSYEILAVNHFNSTRKRMSVICRNNKGEVVLLAKGADNVMFGLTKKSLSESEVQQNAILTQHLDAFANDGLRTLVMAKKHLDEETFTRWKAQYDAASNELGEVRAQKLAQSAEDIETELTVVGASAIEDRLQDGVPETLVALREAGVKTWVLTGDKVETAINISFSARLFSPEMELVQITADTPKENIQTLRELRDLLIPVNLADHSEKRKHGKAMMERPASPRNFFHGFTKAGRTTLHTVELAGRTTLGGLQKTGRAAIKFLRSPEPGDQDNSMRQRAKSENEVSVKLDNSTRSLDNDGDDGFLSSEEDDGVEKSLPRAGSSRIRAETLPEMAPSSPGQSNSTPNSPRKKFKKKRRSIPSFKKFLTSLKAPDSPKMHKRNVSEWRGQSEILPPGAESHDVVNERALLGTEKSLEGFEAKNLALVISGAALAGLLSSELGDEDTEELLLSIARLCSVVVACRVSPKQKALIVRMVKKGVVLEDGTSPITLAIGDGANDVAMIQEARVGIGISGHEGRQAVNSSDFAIAQFRFLQQLMLVHGRWNYRRAASLVLFVFYTNIVFVLTAFVYNFYNKFSGSALNFVFLITVYSYPTQVPIALIACINKDISKHTALEYPAMYISGRKNLHLDKGKSFEWIFKSFFHAFLICAVTIIWAAPPDGNLAVIGTVTYVACVYVSVTMAILETYTWTFLNFGVIAFGYFSMLLFEPIYYGSDPTIYVQYGPTVIWGGGGQRGYFWSAVFLATLMCTTCEVFLMYLRREFIPSLVDIVIEIDRGYGDAKSNKQSKLHKVNKMFRKIAQPFAIPKHAISELLAASNIRGVRRADNRSAFDYDYPEDEGATVAAANNNRPHRSSGFVSFLKNPISILSPQMNTSFATGSNEGNGNAEAIEMTTFSNNQSIKEENEEDVVVELGPLPIRVVDEISVVAEKED